MRAQARRSRGCTAVVPGTRGSTGPSTREHTDPPLPHVCSAGARWLAASHEHLTRLPAPSCHVLGVVQVLHRPEQSEEGTCPSGGSHRLACQGRCAGAGSARCGRCPCCCACNSHGRSCSFGAGTCSGSRAGSPSSRSKGSRDGKCRHAGGRHLCPGPGHSRRPAGRTGVWCKEEGPRMLGWLSTSSCRQG